MHLSAGASCVHVQQAARDEAANPPSGCGGCCREGAQSKSSQREAPSWHQAGGYQRSKRNRHVSSSGVSVAARVGKP